MAGTLGMSDLLSPFCTTGRVAGKMGNWYQVGLVYRFEVTAVSWTVDVNQVQPSLSSLGYPLQSCVMSVI